MRVLYLTQWFEPEPVIKGLLFAKALKSHGYEVEVVTGFPNYPTGRLYEGHRLAFYKREVVDDVVIHRIPLYPSHDGSSVGRILNYLTFLLSAAFFCLLRAGRFDIIYAYSPVTVGLAAAFGGWIARKPFVLDIQDLWPDSVVKSGMPGTRRMGAVLHWLCSFVYRRSTHIISQSVGIRARLIERGVPSEKISVVYNWADEEAAAPGGVCNLTPYGFEGHFNIVYGGNLGRVQGLDTLVLAARLAHERVPEIQLLLIGNGIEEDNLKQMIKEQQIVNVRIEPGIPRAEIGDVFAAADVLVLHLWNDPLFEITIPQKTQFYMAMGKPVLIGANGEAADFIIRAEAGLAVVPQNVEAMANAMVQLATTPRKNLAEMGARAQAAYAREFSFDKAIAKTEEVLDQANKVWQ